MLEPKKGQFIVKVTYWHTVWLVISVGLKFLWISCAMLIHKVIRIGTS